MSDCDRKRNSIETIYNPAKRIKYFNESDEENDNQLQIDLDMDFTNIEKYSNNKMNDISWERPMSFDYVSVTLSTGHRCYVRIDDRTIERNKVNKSDSNCASEDFYRLLDEAEEILRKRKDNQTISIPNSSEVSNVLWVTKYVPKKYTELISTESINRSFLSWMKSWDKHVFNKESRFVEKLMSNTNVSQGFNVEEQLKINSKDGLPVKKIILLAGAPGLGKTTLAQIIARHCGYYPIEVNASDERSPEIFRMRISMLNDTRHGLPTITDGNQLMKPCCLILDEIDGAPTAAISVLINAINAANPKPKDASTSHSNKKKENHLTINRPVICICNDLYASSLKQLRPLCFVVKVIPPDFNQLLQRLTDICKLEGVECDRTVLTNLIDISNRDIRSCLNTLQFLKTQGKEDIRGCDLKNMNIGQKDIESSVFRIWEEIFTEPSVKKSNFLNLAVKGSDLSKRYHNILKLSYSIGDVDRIVTGIHENYLSIIRFKDLFMNGVVSAAEWMVFNDLATKQINAKQDYQMIKYKEQIIPFFHLSFASTAIVPGSIRWPATDINAHFNRQKMEAIYDSFINGQGRISDWIKCKEDVIKYVLPNLVNIIRPTQLKPINTQLYSNKEKRILQNTVDIMISTGLEYIQERLAELQYQYVLSPNIEDLVQFNVSEVLKKELTYSTKQLIANEINREKIKKFKLRGQFTKSLEPLTSLGKKVSNDECSQSRIDFIMRKEKEIKSVKSMINNNKTRESFSFKLFNKKTCQAGKEPNSVPKIFEQPVWFRFKEGFSNAIRRPVKMKDL